MEIGSVLLMNQNRLASKWICKHFHTNTLTHHVCEVIKQMYVNIVASPLFVFDIDYDNWLVMIYYVESVFRQSLIPKQGIRICETLFIYMHKCIL